MSHDVFQNVLDFHVAMKPDFIGTTPQFPYQSLIDHKLELIREEIAELFVAILNRDICMTADAIGDSVYVLYGLAVALGIDMRPIDAEIHRTNMAKAGGPIRADGKIQKPPGWQPPDIAGTLARQPPLDLNGGRPSDPERELWRTDRLGAIRAYRGRRSCSLQVAVRAFASVGCRFPADPILSRNGD